MKTWNDDDENDHFLWGVSESRTLSSVAHEHTRRHKHADCSHLHAEEGKLKALIRLWFPINSSVPSEQNTSHTHIVTSEHSYTLRRSLPSTHALWESNNPSGLF